MESPFQSAVILIVDDDPIFCAMLSDLVQGMGYQVLLAHRLDDCRQALSHSGIDLVLLDVGLPDGSGLNALPWIRGITPAPEVIIITGEGDADGAELAVTNGAWDYLVKTAALERIRLTIARALDHHRTALALRAAKPVAPCGIVGCSPCLMQSLDLMRQASLHDFNVLISGETGTGKERFAQAIHANSDRATGRLVVVDCSALPQTLVESVLFGYVKGAFTGAEKDSEGLFRKADGGTLFMDEVGELPQDLQRIFLRVLQEKAFRPVGAGKEVVSNFRLIAATNKDLDQLADQGLFRKDLLFRLKAMQIHLPPLRDRLEDLPLLAEHILGEICQVVPQLSEEFGQALASHDWPGNIRELKNLLQGAVAASMGARTLLVQHLSPELRVKMMRKDLEPIGQKCAAGIKTEGKRVSLTDIREYRKLQDREYLVRLLEEFQGDMQGAALRAGLSLSRLYSLIREHGIKQNPLKEQKE